MNLPVVLFNTKKENENRNTNSKSRLAFIKESTQATERRTGPLLEGEALVITILSHLEGAVAKRTKVKLICFTGSNDRQLMLSILRGG